MADTEAPIAYLEPPTRDQDRFTGANCPPEKRKAIIEGIKSGVPILPLSKSLQVSPQTVTAVRDADLGPDWRKESSNGLKRIARSLIGHIDQSDLNTVPWTVKPILLGIVLDKIATLDGEPTQIVEHRHSVDIGSLKSALSAPAELVIEAEVTTIENQALTEPPTN